MIVIQTFILRVFCIVYVAQYHIEEVWHDFAAHFPTLNFITFVFVLYLGFEAFERAEQIWHWFKGFRERRSKTDDQANSEN